MGKHKERRTKGSDRSRAASRREARENELYDPPNRAGRTKWRESKRREAESK